MAPCGSSRHTTQVFRGRRLRRLPHPRRDGADPELLVSAAEEPKMPQDCLNDRNGAGPCPATPQRTPSPRCSCPSGSWTTAARLQPLKTRRACSSGSGGGASFPDHPSSVGTRNAHPLRGRGLRGRVCPGRHFATDALFIFIASFLHVFDIQPRTGADGRREKIERRVDFDCTLS